MKKKLIKVGVWLSIVAIWMLCIHGGLQAYTMYKYYQLHPQTEFEYDSLYGTVPEEAAIKLDMITRLTNTLRIGLGFLLIYTLLDYFRDPKKHFVTFLSKKIVPFIEKYGGSLEDDELEDEIKDRRDKQ